MPELVTEWTERRSIILKPDEYRAALARKANGYRCSTSGRAKFARRIQIELCNRHPVGDWKLVRGKQTARGSPDEVTVQSVFNDKWGIPDEYLFDAPKMKSPAQIEKSAIPGKDKKTVKSIVASLAKKPQGKLAIAPGSDARDAVDPVSIAAADFANDEEEFVQ